MTSPMMSDDKPPQKKHGSAACDNFLQNGEPKNTKELFHVITEAKQRDVITEDAQEMIEGVLDVTNLKVRDIMIPRSQMAPYKTPSAPKT